MGEANEELLNYSNRNLKEIPKAKEHESQTIVTLNLDENELPKLDHVDSYLRLENLSGCRNNLMRMHGVGKLTYLRDLNLSNNSILTIEGLKDLVLLKKLQLSRNKIKSIEHLNNNTNLEYLDLSDNQISHMSDISYLKNLKTLLLERNRIKNLTQCERYLPTTLVSFGMAGNSLTDLNTVCHLHQLQHLESITIEGNPCVGEEKIEDEKIHFDYRPFVINWVINVKLVDGIEVSAIERLKAEWLYSQGKGRQYREGEHSQLIQYLHSTCPLESTAPETEEQRKLRLILSKAQQHQQQLIAQGPTPPRTNKQSPRMHARITGRVVTKSPDRMSASFHSGLIPKNHSLLGIQSSPMSTSFSGEIPCHTTPIKNILDNKSFDSSNIMSQSCYEATAMFSSESITDKNQKENILLSAEKSKIKNELKESKELKCESNYDSNKALNQPLEAASKMVPVPDSLMSPDYQGPLFTAVQPGVLNSNAQNIISNKSIPSVNGSHSPQVVNTRYKSQMKTPTSITKSAVNSNIKSNLGSPQMSRSAMSSPKLRHAEQRKGSFSSRTTPQTNEDSTHLAKNAYNQRIHTPNKGKSTLNEVNTRKTLNGANRTPNATKREIPVKGAPADTKDHNSSDDDSEMCMEKLQSIRDAANQRRQKQSVSDSASIDSSNASKVSKNEPTHTAAVTIQKLWRGYRTRNLNPKTGKVVNSIQTMRARQYIEKLSCDMEATKAALDSERKIQQLQMQAINALWKKISAMEGNGDKGIQKGVDEKGDNAVEKSKDESDLSKESAVSKGQVQELTQAFNILQAQVQLLQGSLGDILKLVSARGINLAESNGTQTEISAVHTPQGDNATNWPYHKAASRPSSLSLTVQNNNFKKSLSNGSDKKETVQTKDVKDSKDVSLGTLENLPGQADSSTDTMMMTNEGSSGDGKTESVSID